MAVAFWYLVVTIMGSIKKSYTYKCDKVSAHTKAAIAYANSHKYGPGKYQVQEIQVLYFLDNN